MKPTNYTITHIHTELSNPTTIMDSITNYKEYVDKALECGMTSICFTEHGNIYEWLHKKEYIEKMGMKYIHGVEAYVTETLDEKIRDNYHMVLIAKNYEGVKELNHLISHKKAFNRNDGHFYYRPRITYEELKSTSDNIIITSACLGGILNNGNVELKKDFIEFMQKNKHRCYLEVQPHLVEDQVKYNKILYTIHNKTGIPLILGTDTHALNNEHLKGRAVLQKRKDILFESENEFDLTFKTFEEVVEMLKIQNSMPMDIYYEAIENTNILADSIETFEVDRSHKYPKLSKNPQKTFMAKIKEGIERRGIKLTKEEKDRIQKEFKTYKSNGAIDYMLLEEDVKSWCRKNDIQYGYARGSASGSYIAYLMGITDTDSIKYNLNFERFMNEERVSLADIDTDYPPSKRDLVKKYITSKDLLYCSEIITFNKIELKGSIKDAGGGLGYDLNLINEISKNIEDNEQEYRNKYPELFEYVDLLRGTVVSIGSHPCGLLVSPTPITTEIGTFTTSQSEYPVSCLNMKELDSLNYVKLDILGLDNIEAINETCKLANIERLTPDNTDYTDWNVWNSIREDTLAIFQWEGDYAHSYLEQLFGDSTLKKIKAQNENFSMIDLFSVGNGAIRPAGQSYRDALSSGEFRDNGHEALNNLLSSTMGYLVFQEQVMAFLNQFCGFSMGKADIVRRGFAKKIGTDEFIPEIKEGFIKTMIEKYGETKQRAEELIINFITVIEDASRYLFSLNHSDPYSRIGYACGWLRYYYPLEFLTVLFRINSNRQEKTAKIIEYMKTKTDIKLNPIKFRYSRADYSFNKETNSIYKGIASLKYLNEQVAEELYELKDKKFDSFVELLLEIKLNTSCDARQLKILIILNFFSEFGKSKKLISTNDIFDNIYGRKQIKKSDIQAKYKDIGLTMDMMKKYSNKETEKIFKDFDSLSLVKELCSKLENKSLGIKERISSELDYLGYIDFVYPDANENLYFVEEFKTYKDKTKPYLNLYRIKNGEKVKARITKGKTFISSPFKGGVLLKVDSMVQKPKSKLIDGKWVKSKTEFNNIIEEYEVY